MISLSLYKLGPWLKFSTVPNIYVSPLLDLGHCVMVLRRTLISSLLP